MIVDCVSKLIQFIDTKIYWLDISQLLVDFDAWTSTKDGTQQIFSAGMASYVVLHLAFFSFCLPEWQRLHKCCRHPDLDDEGGHLCHQSKSGPS